LRSLGVGYIKTIQEMPIEMLQRVLGKHGTSLWKKAQGLDKTPVIPYQEQKSISIERTFDRDTAAQQTGTHTLYGLRPHAYR